MPHKDNHNLDWWLLAGTAVLALSLGMLGFHQYTLNNPGNSPLNTLDLLYRSLQLFTLDSGSIQSPLPVTLEIARWLAPSTTFFAAIKGFLSLVRKRGQSLLRLRNIQDHAIVCGLSHKGTHIAQALLNKGIRVVVIDNTPQSTSLSTLTRAGVISVTGDAQDSAILQSAKIQTARYLFATTGDDAGNISIIHEAHKLVTAKDSGQNRFSLDCYAHVSDHRTGALFYNHPLFSESSERFNAQVISLYDRGARLLFDAYAPDRYQAIRSPEDPPASILIFGFSPLAKSLVLHAAHTGHYANKKNPVITLVDEQATQQVTELAMLAPALEQLLDIKTQNASIDSLSTERLQDVLGDPPNVIYICAESDIHALILAQRLAQLPGIDKTPIVVGLLQTDTLTELLFEDSRLQHNNITLFPLIKNTSNLEQIIGEQQDEAAKIIHDMYREDQFKQGETVESNPSLAPWESLPEDLKDSNRGQADHLPIKLRAIGLTLDEVLNASKPLVFTPEQIRLLADMEHQRWMAGKRLDGWRPTTGKKDTQRKLNPLLVDFSELEDKESRKDELVVHSLHLIANLKACR